MRFQIPASLVVGIGALALWGCSQQQKVEAGNQAEHAKQQAQHALQNAIKVWTDDQITLKVKAAMGSSDKLNTSDIHVVTKNRVCFLKGAVADAGQKTLAERIAKDTVGLDVKVVDSLQIGQVAKSTKKKG